MKIKKLYLAELRFPRKGKRDILGQTIVRAIDKEDALKLVEIETAPAEYEVIAIGLYEN